MTLHRRWSILAMSLTGVLLVGTLAALAILQARPAAEPPPGVPKVAVDDANVHLGILDSPKKFRHTYTIRNEGDGPLSLAPAKGNCSCLVLGLPEGSIDPGDQARIAVSFDLLLKSGDVHRTISLLTNDPEAPELKLELYARLRARLTAKPEQVQLALKVAEPRKPAETYVFSQIWKHFDLVAVKKSLEGMSLRIAPASPEQLKRLDAQCGYRVEVAMPPDLPDGQFAEWIQFQGKPVAAPNEGPLPLKLEVHGRLDGRLTLHGQRIDKNRVLRLGTIPSGQQVRETVVMKVNDERHGLKVHRVETDPDFLHASLVPFESSATTGLYRLEVAVPADAPAANCMGDQAATVRLRTDHPRLPLIELKVDFAVLQGGAGHAHVAAR